MLLVVLLIAAVIWFGSVFWRQAGSNSDPTTSQKGATINYQPYKTFTTPYFKLQTDQNWQPVAQESTGHHYVYRAFKGKLVERDLTVYVNELPPRLMLTYVLPATPLGNHLQTTEVSQHCRASLPPSYLKTSNNPTTTTIGGVSFTCQTDGTGTTIGSGVKGGSYQANLRRTDGSTANYFLLYHDLAFTPRPQLFKAIVDSFKSL